jgi:hypothetical protein
MQLSTFLAEISPRAKFCYVFYLQKQGRTNIETKAALAGNYTLERMFHAVQYAS